MAPEWHWARNSKGSKLLKGTTASGASTMVLLAFLALGTTGCVTRKYTIDSQPQGALVYRDGKPIGTTPVDDYFVFYGKYRFTLVKDGYETLHVEQKIPAPWYEYLPLDFVSENLVPWEIKDVHRFSYALQPQQMPNNNDILQKAGDLRNRGKALVPLRPKEAPSVPAASPGAIQPVAPGTAAPLPLTTALAPQPAP